MSSMNALQFWIFLILVSIVLFVFAVDGGSSKTSAPSTRFNPLENAVASNEQAKEVNNEDAIPSQENNVSSADSVSVCLIC